MKKAFERIGSIVNESHPATPVVLGDFEIMKGWGGDDGSGNDGELVAVEGPKAKGNLFLPDLELHAPTVFRRGADEVWLLASGEVNYDLRDEYTEKELANAVSAKFPPPEDALVINVASGALAIALAYEKKPAKGAPPKALVVGKTLIVVPVEAGPYEIATAMDDEAWMRVRLKKVSAAALAAFEKEHAAAEKDETEVVEKIAEVAKPVAAGPVDAEVVTKEPASVRSLVVQTQWPAMFSRDATGKTGGRLRIPSRGEIPDVFAKLSNLEILHVDGELGAALPASVGKCTKLETLKLDMWKHPVELPSSLAKLMNLVELELPATVTSLPGGLPYPKLKKLSLPYDLLVAHRADLAGLTSLEELIVVASAKVGAHGAWESPDRDLPRGELPEEITKLRLLRRLELSRVGAETLPALEKLPKLETLSLWCTRTTSVLDRVRAAPALKNVSLTGTRLSAWEERAIPKLLETPPGKRAAAKLPSKRKAEAAPDVRRLFIPGWDAIASFATSPDGKLVVAGERGGHRVCAWDFASGALKWEQTLFDVHLIDANVHVAFDAEGKLVVSASTIEGHFFWLALGSGKIERKKQIGGQGVSGAFYPFVLLDRATPKYVAAAQLGGMGSGPCAVYSYPEIAGVGQLPGAPGAVAADGSAFTIDRGEDLVVMTAGALRGRGGISRVGPHAFTPDGKSVVVIGDELEAFVHDATSGKQTATFCWAPDAKELPSRKQPGVAWPVFDAKGGRLAIVRSSLGSKIDGTVGVLSWKSKKLLTVLPAHERPLARLDPGFGSQKLHSSRRDEIPMVRWHGDEVIVGALVRGDDEARVGTGLTLHRCPS